MRRRPDDPVRLPPTDPDPPETRIPTRRLPWVTSPAGTHHGRRIPAARRSWPHRPGASRPRRTRRPIPPPPGECPVRVRPLSRGPFGGTPNAAGPPPSLYGMPPNAAEHPARRASAPPLRAGPYGRGPGLPGHGVSHDGDEGSHATHGRRLSPPAGHQPHRDRRGDPGDRDRDHVGTYGAASSSATGGPTTSPGGSSSSGVCGSSGG